MVTAKNESVPQQESPVSADLTVQNQESDSTFTITAKSLQGLDGYEGSEDSILVSYQWDEKIITSNQADGPYTVTAKPVTTKTRIASTKRKSSMWMPRGQNKFVKKSLY